ncbi:probable membrane-associated kinase regulator 1 [Cajanus cajan]|uniref:probable membrane-associated kinase regulator 1 n=1 Tax=Cajanus cajan TaxID=3821 RepID=UPI0010FB8825|nr:probable membrane-associated kinase regulator 1 [Cajanus cajan]
MEIFLKVIESTICCYLLYILNVRIRVTLSPTHYPSPFKYLPLLLINSPLPTFPDTFRITKPVGSLMATNIVQAKWENNAEQEEEEEEDQEEEEALSLCDLPIDQPPNQQHSHANEATQEDFDFRSWGAPFEMCVADEVFFKGQILPLRLSFSSEAGLLATPTTGSHKKHYGKQSSSESLDFTSNSSSRSSSLRSQNSSSSTSSTTTTTTSPRARNQFHTHPSPKPQLRAPTPSSLGNQGRKSTSAWGIFRLGVVPAPEIGLQDLKIRNNRSCVSRNSSSGSSNNSGKSVNRNKGSHNKVLKQLVGKGGGLLSGCDCSLETVQSNTVMMIKGGAAAKSVNKTESTTHAAKEKVVESKKKHKEGKKVTSRRSRTFEWLKELHATHPDEEPLLSNAS